MNTSAHQFSEGGEVRASIDRLKKEGLELEKGSGFVSASRQKLYDEVLILRDRLVEREDIITEYSKWHSVNMLKIESLEEENKKLKEALKDIISTHGTKLNWTDYQATFNARKAAIEMAKQLINETK